MPSKRPPRPSKKKPARRPAPSRTTRPARALSATDRGLRIEPAMLKRIAGLIIDVDMWGLALKSKLHIVCLHTASGHDSEPTLSKLRRDAVAWKNHDVQPRTIKFGSDCPLVGFPSGGMTLDPGESSPAYLVREGADLGKCVYDIVPPFEIGGTGPGEPVIIVEG
jgi:hypothetical protein